MTKNPKKELLKEVGEIIDSAGIRKEKAEMLKKKLDLVTTCMCDGDGSGTKKEKKKREPSPRNEFMGLCMRSADKGGMGKGMKECSDKFKQMSPDEKKRYMSNGENK